jgi:hypothetical protein
MNDLKRRKFGAFETPPEIFKNFIFPRIKDELEKYIWVDLYCGSGNLILPILEFMPKEKRIKFFEEHIFLFDILPEMVNKAIENAVRLGIPEEIAKKNIKVKDVLKDFPKEILTKNFPVFHITNPPYMYIGYIKKNKEFSFWLEYFKDNNEGYQDLYQLALINDLRHKIPKLVYIIPTNFLFGASASNKIRKDFLFWYNIKEALIFEKKIFEFTGQNVGIFFFERKKYPIHEPQSFKITKINKEQNERIITIKPSRFYRAGDEFSDFVENFKSKIPIEVKFYLFIDEIKKNLGKNKIIAVDSNAYQKGGYKIREFFVNEELYTKIKENILFLKTVDGVRENEKAGIYSIPEIYKADCIVVSKAPYRTHPIQLFFQPSISIDDQMLLKDYFNLMLNYFREKTDSEFMTTYKYSDVSFTRKYLGLTQAKKLIQTFPILEIDELAKELIRKMCKEKNVENIINFLKKLRERNNNLNTLF